MTTPIATTVRAGLMGAGHVAQLDAATATAGAAQTTATAAQGTASAAAPKSGATFTGPVLVADLQGAIASGATVSPDVTPASGKQCFSYGISANCTLGALAGTGAMAADTAISGTVYLTFSGAATVTLAAAYKLPAGVSNGITGAASEVWRLDFLYRRTANRCSASIIKEAI